jgi:hypothetical protein
LIEGIKSLQQIPGVLEVKIGTHNCHFYEVRACASAVFWVRCGAEVSVAAEHRRTKTAPKALPTSLL